MTRLILSPWQVRAALRGELKMVLLPVKPQPPGGIIPIVKKLGMGLELSRVDVDYYLALSPYVGQRLWIAETWRCMVDETLFDCIEYKKNEKIKPENLSSQDGYYFDWLCNNEKQWRSPATMPKYASRMEFEVQGVGCKMLKDLTEEEAALCGATLHCPVFDECSEPVPCRVDCPLLSPLDVLKERWLLGQWRNRYGSRYPWDSTWVWTVSGEVKK